MAIRLRRLHSSMAGAALLTLLVAASSALAADNVSTLDPVSPPAESIRYLFIFLVAVTGAILALVWGVLFYSIFRFRHKEAGGTAEPPQFYGSKPIEIAWTAGPALIVFLIVLVVIRTEYEVRVDPAKPPKGSEPLYVTVVGHQWWWEYRYYDKYYEDFDKAEPQFVTANELHVPASDPGESGVKRPVYLNLRSADVIHSYWVPRLAGKTDLIPRRKNHMWFETDQTGLYLGQCAEFCGTQHANMLLRVYVDSPQDFETWRMNQRSIWGPSAESFRPNSLPKKPDPVDEGRKVFLSQSCVNCHTVRYTTRGGTFGPDLTHLMSRKTLAAGMVENNRENLRRWVKDPQKIKPGCLMPAFGLSDEQVDLIVTYLESLK